MADSMLIDGLIKFCNEKSKNIKLKAEPQVFVEIAKQLEKLKQYKDAEEQGLIVKLPVTIGSDIYYIPSNAHYGLNILHHHEEFNRVYHQKIARLHFTESGWYVEGNLNLEYGVVDRIFVDKLYKETWFLSQEEAEQELEKMKQSHERLSELCKSY